MPKRYQTLSFTNLQVWVPSQLCYKSHSTHCSVLFTAFATKQDPQMSNLQLCYKTTSNCSVTYLSVATNHFPCPFKMYNPIQSRLVHSNMDAYHKVDMKIQGRVGHSSFSAGGSRLANAQLIQEIGK